MVHLHIDRDPLSMMTFPNLTRVMTNDNHDENTIAFSDVVPEKLEPLKTFVGEYLDECNGIQKAFENEKNSLSIEILKLANFMVSCGFYKNEEEIKELVDPMISLLDGTDDLTYAEEEIGTDMGEEEQVQEHERTVDRYAYTEDTQKIMECKNLICEILIKIAAIRMDMRITLFLRNFKKEINTNPDFQQEDASTSKFTKSPTMNFLNKMGGYGKLFNKSQPKDSSVIMVSIIDKILEEKTLDLQDMSKSDFISVLLDLCLYDYGELINHSFQLLIAQYSQKKFFIQTLSQIQVYLDYMIDLSYKCSP